MKPQIEGMRQAIPYLQKYRGKCFVIKVGGALLEKEESLAQISESIAALYHVGIQMVIVHGGGPQLNEMTTRLGKTSRIIGGRRVTDASTLDVAKMILAGRINTDFVAALSAHEIPAVGLSGIDGMVIKATRRPPVFVEKENQEVDFGFVGDIQKVEPKLLQDLCKADYVPVLCSLSTDGKGQVLNINADTVAQQIAVSLQAQKYILLTSVNGILKNIADPGSLIPYADISMIETMKRDGLLQGGMLPKVEACIAALRGGVKRAHIINGFEKNSLLAEIFTNEGCGTLIVEKIESNGNYESS